MTGNRSGATSLPLGYDSIRRYLTALQPVLDQWISQGVASLRQITHDHVTQAVAARQGNPARAVHRGLRSVFGALKQERMIFRDPSRGLTHRAAEILPTWCSPTSSPGCSTTPTAPSNG